MKLAQIFKLKRGIMDTLRGTPLNDTVVANVPEAQAALAQHIKGFKAADVIRRLDMDTPFVARFRQQEAEAVLQQLKLAFMAPAFIQSSSKWKLSSFQRSGESTGTQLVICVRVPKSKKFRELNKTQKNLGWATPMDPRLLTLEFGTVSHISLNLTITNWRLLLKPPGEAT